MVFLFGWVLIDEEVEKVERYRATSESSEIDRRRTYGGPH